MSESPTHGDTYIVTVLLTKHLLLRSLEFFTDIGMKSLQAVEFWNNPPGCKEKEEAAEAIHKIISSQDQTKLNEVPNLYRD